MKDISTTLLGMKIKSPIVLGACNLSYMPNRLAEFEEAGIGAIVYKTLFEEQVQLESFEFDEQLHLYDERNAEMVNLFPKIEHGGPAEHVLKLKETVKAVNVPVIASLNCIFEETWVEYAKELANAGASALELNFYDTPKRFERTSLEIEDYQTRVVGLVKKAVNIPVQVKLSRFYGNVLNLVQRMDNEGADGFVMFNRLFLPDINPEKEEFLLNWEFSSPEEKLYTMRVAGLLSGNIKGDIIASNGIYSTSDVVSMILAGANSVQMVSAMYRNGSKHLVQVLENLDAWMERKGYDSLADFRGNMDYNNVKDKFQYTRSQYVDILLRKTPVFAQQEVR